MSVPTTEPVVETAPPPTVPPTTEPCSTGVVVDGVCQPVGGCCEPEPTTTTTVIVVPTTTPALPVTGSEGSVALVGGAALLLGIILTRIARS